MDQQQPSAPDEYETLARIARSTADADRLNELLAEARLPGLRDRMARLDEYAVRPLRIADPVRHLDNALGFVLDAMGRHDVSDGLSRAPRTDAYRLMVGYMRAYLVRANEHCYAAEAEAAAAAASAVVLDESAFRRHLQENPDGPCAHLFARDDADDGGGGGGLLDWSDGRRVRGAVRHIFADWDPTTATAGGPGLDMFLVYDQYERLSRDGVFGLAPGGRLLTRASVPADPAHAHCALLRAFVRARYDAGYLDRLVWSLRSAFAPPFLEAVAAAYAALDHRAARSAGHAAGDAAGDASGDGGGRRPARGLAIDPAVVVQAARSLNVPWFAEGTETPEPADMYYAHGGFHPV